MSIETKRTIRFHTMAILLIIVFCISITPRTFQNDTFYTIKIGEYVLNNGVTMQEPFSWHENLKYTFPHWLYDVLTYYFYSIGGFLGVYILTAILASVLGVVIYIANVRISKSRAMSFIITLLTLYLLIPYICARAQLVTFILFILTVLFINRFLETRRIWYAIGLIIIPILIANMHAATFLFYFVLYLPYLAECGLYILSYCNVIICGTVIDIIKKKIKKHGETEKLTAKLEKEEKRYKRLLAEEDKKIKNPYKLKICYSNNVKWLLIIFIVCIFTGFLTPLGDVPYTYLIKTMKGISTKNISEHLPIVLADNKNALIIFIFYFLVIAFTKIKIRVSDACMLFGLGLLAIFTRRQISMFYLVGSLILTKLVVDLFIDFVGEEEDIKKFDNTLSGFIPIIIIIGAVMSISINQYMKKMKDPFVDETRYPVHASEWIKQNLDLSEIKPYNEYNNGSYLLFQGIPVFIDSRCDLYMTEFNENVNVFRDFLGMNNVNLSNIDDKIEEYGFTHFIVSRGSRFNAYLDDRPYEYKKIYPLNGENDNFNIYERIKE